MNAEVARDILKGICMLTLLQRTKHMRPCSVGHEAVQRGQEKYIFHLLNIFLQENLIMFLWN